MLHSTVHKHIAERKLKYKLNIQLVYSIFEFLYVCALCHIVLSYLYNPRPLNLNAFHAFLFHVVVFVCMPCPPYKRFKQSGHIHIHVFRNATTQYNLEYMYSDSLNRCKTMHNSNWLRNILYVQHISVRYNILLYASWNVYSLWG